MHNRFLTRWTISLVVLFAPAVLGARALHAESEVRFQLVRDALIIVPVTANDEGPLYFLLDTGADTTVVDTAVAKRLSLTALRTVEQATVTGSQTVRVAVLGKLAVGGVQVEGLPVLEQDLSELRKVDGRIAGILGQNFLSQLNYLVNYRTKRLRIEESGDLRETLEGEAVPVEMASHRMMMAATVEAKGQAPLRLMLDSGATTLVLMGQVSVALHCPILQPQMETSSAGTAVMRMGRVDLTVAAHAFRDVTAVLADQSQKGVGDGLLPMALFDAVYVNNAQGYVVVNPHEKKAVQVAMAGGAR